MRLWTEQRGHTALGTGAERPPAPEKLLEAAPFSGDTPLTTLFTAEEPMPHRVSAPGAARASKGSQVRCRSGVRLLHFCGNTSTRRCPNANPDAPDPMKRK